MIEIPDKLHFRTGEVAKIIGCSARMVCKWFDAGQIGGYRLPCSQDRRIPRDELVRFIQERVVRLTQTTANNIAIISANGLAQALEPHLPAVDGFEIKPLAGAMDVLNSGLELSPRVAVLDFTIGQPEAVGACRTLRRLFGLQLPIIALDATGDVPDVAESFRRPVDYALIAARIRALAKGGAE